MPNKRWFFVITLAGLFVLAGVQIASGGSAGGGQPASNPDAPAAPLQFTGAGVLVPTPTAGVPADAVRIVQLADWGGDRANTLAFSPDGQWLAVGSSLGIYVYDAQTLAETRFIPTDTWVRSLAFSPGGDRLVTGSYDAVVRVWSVADGTLLSQLAGHTSWVRSVAFSSDGDTVASASDDHTVRLWSLTGGGLLHTFAEGNLGARTVAFSPDGALLASGGYDNAVHLWRVADGKLERTLTGHTGWVRCLAFSPDGDMLASGGFDATVRLWRVADGETLHTYAGHTASVLGVAFSPDGAQLASGSVDTTIRLWQVADGASVGRLSGHTDFVFTVAFSPDGATLASGAVDNTVRLWALTPEALAVAAEDVARVSDHASSSNCVICHHPHGDLRQPGVVGQPARVIEAGCSLCHAGTSLVLNWCPAFPRVEEKASVSVPPPAITTHHGVPRGTPNLNVVMSTPGNGEYWYASGEMRSVVLVNGYVDYTGPQFSDIDVRMEIWSGDTLMDVLSSPAQPDGTFTFGINLNPQGSQLEVPIDMLDCLPCHDPTDAVIVLPTFNLTNVKLNGEIRLLITATTPAGERATDERWVHVDRTGEAAVAVEVLVEGASGQPVAGLDVGASTILYEWRGRSFTGSTSGDGVAQLRLEASAELPTRYSVYLLPTIVDGLLYESVAPVEVTLPPGATSADPLTLMVRAQPGSIEGRLAGLAGGLDALVPVRAIVLPEGLSYRTVTDVDGLFAFADLPVDDYLIAPDPAALAALSMASTGQHIDLASAPRAEDIVVPMWPVDGLNLQGVVRDASGQPLPFAWVTVDDTGQGRPVGPDAGDWQLLGVSPQSKAVVAAAPGFFSQASAIPDGTKAAVPLDVSLVERPDTRRIAWGDGAIILPAETLATSDGQHLVLEHGWVWGEGAGLQPVTIEVAGVMITLPGGRFALEYVPGQTAWLYVFEGEAEVRDLANSGRISRLTANTMLALNTLEEFRPAPLDPAVISALHPQVVSPLIPVWEPSLEAQVRNRLARMGINTAQIITFVTYSMVLVALVVAPIVGLLWWSRHNRQHRNQP